MISVSHDSFLPTSARWEEGTASEGDGPSWPFPLMLSLFPVFILLAVDTGKHQWSCLFQSVGGAYRYAHVMFELSFYLTKLVLTAPFINTIPPTNPRTDTAIEEGIPSHRLFCSLSTITLLPPPFPPNTYSKRARTRNVKRRGWARRVRSFF